MLQLGNPTLAINLKHATVLLSIESEIRLQAFLKHVPQLHASHSDVNKDHKLSSINNLSANTWIDILSTDVGNTRNLRGFGITSGNQ